MTKQDYFMAFSSDGAPLMFEPGTMAAAKSARDQHWEDLQDEAIILRVDPKDWGMEDADQT